MRKNTGGGHCFDMNPRQPKHRSRTYTVSRQRKVKKKKAVANAAAVDAVDAVESESDSKSNTHTSPKKPAASNEEYLWLITPDRNWEPIPFADADVPPGKLEHAKKLAIDAMAEWGVYVEASRASRIGRNKLQEYMRADPAFKLRMRGAKKNNDERIEREMRRRAQLPKGELAAIFVMKHNIRRYREVQRLELTGAGGGPVTYADIKSELLKRVEQIALKQSQGAVAVGERERPRLLKGSGDAEVHWKKEEREGFQAKSRK